MTPETKAILIARLKSYAWRCGCIMVLAGLDYVSQNLTGIGIPAWAITGLGLGISEVTKYINDHTTLFGAARKG